MRDGVFVAASLEGERAALQNKGAALLRRRTSALFLRCSAAVPLVIPGAVVVHPRLESMRGSDVLFERPLFPVCWVSTRRAASRLILREACGHNHFFESDCLLSPSLQSVDLVMEAVAFFCCLQSDRLT